MRAKDLAGRPGKQSDGSAKTREVKLCTVWSAEGRDERGMAVRDKGSVTSSAAIESAATLDTQLSLSDFAHRVQREADRSGFSKAHRQVVLGDGALWIWAIAHSLFPYAIQIVDRYHVKEALHEVAKAIWGPGSALGREWADQRCLELDLGRLDDLIRALSTQARTSDQARRCADYIDRNRFRMDCPSFHCQGLCTSSGVVEAGCKVVVGARLLRAPIAAFGLPPDVPKQAKVFPGPAGKRQSPTLWTALPLDMIPALLTCGAV
jgi:hypothetical protein